MCHLKLRFLAALVTFGLGLGLVSVLNIFRFAPVGLADVPAPQMVLTRAPAAGEQACGCAVTQKAWERLTSVSPTNGARVITGGLLQGKAISKPQPFYPPIAKAARASGTVRVQVIVGEDGRVIAARAIYGHPLLQESSVRAACRSRFTPTLLAGEPVRVSGIITYNYLLP